MVSRRKAYISWGYKHVDISRGYRSMSLAEVMVSRVCLLLYILNARSATWLYEQPASTLLFEHPRMQFLFRQHSCFRVHTWMGSFGGDSPKATYLYSNKASVGTLRRSLQFDCVRPASTAVKYCAADGTPRVSGGPDLKRTQSYTPEFAWETLRMWECTPQTQAEPALPQKECSYSDPWFDARLDDVFKALT